MIKNFANGKKILVLFFYIAAVVLGINGYTWHIAEEEALAEEPGVFLTPEEQAWLDSHSVIRVHNEKDWTPFNFYKNGLPQGFSIDFMNLLSEKVGFQVEYVTGPTWNEFLEMAKRKEVDVILNIAQSEDRDKFLVFTDPYIQFAQALYTRVGSSPITSINDLYGKKFAVPSGFYFEDVLREHPQIELVRVNNTAEAIMAVSNGNADAMLDLMPVVNYLMKQLMVTNLKTGGELGLEEGKPIYLRIGVRKDWGIFRNILQKGMGTIGEDEIHRLRNKWLEFSEKKGIVFTKAERKWLASHPVLRLGVDPAWPPFEFIDQKGHYAGITSGFMEAISDRLGIKMIPVPGLTWHQAHEKFRAGEIDLHPGVIRTPAREQYMNFTKPYLSFPIVTATHKNTPLFGTIQELAGYRVGVVKDYYTEDILRNDYPNLNLVTYPTVAKALRDLDAGHIDAFIDNLVVINYEITRSGLENTRISAPTAYAVDLSIGVRKDLPELVGILNKAIDDIGNQEKAAIKSTWMTDVEVKIRFDYKAIMAWAIPIGGSVILIIVFVVIWNRRLGREITERKRTEAQLEQAEERSRLLLESANEGIFGVGEDGLVNFINPAGLKMLGFDTEEVIGQEIHPLIHHTRSDGTPYPLEECPMSRSLTQGTMASQDDEVLWRKDGTSFYVEYSCVPIRKDGSIAGTVIVFRDISKRKAAEESIRESEARLSTILKTTKQGFWLVDNDTNTIEVNDAMCEILDRSREEIMGRKVYDFLDEENGTTVRNQKRLRNENKQSLYEVSILRPDKTRVPCLVNASPLFDSGGNKIGSFGMFTDITDQKQMEVALKRNVEELERFNKLAIGRELKMIQLKEEVNELLLQSNQNMKYKIVK